MLIGDQTPWADCGRAVFTTMMTLALTLSPAMVRGEGKGVIRVHKAALKGKPTILLRGGSAHVRIVGATEARYLEVPAYESTDQRLSVVVKQYDKVSLRLIDWPEDEFMVIVSGEVKITDADGHAAIYGAGNALVIPKGFSGTWAQRGRIVMYTVSYTATP